MPILIALFRSLSSVDKRSGEGGGKEPGGEMIRICEAEGVHRKFGRYFTREGHFWLSQINCLLCPVLLNI